MRENDAKNAPGAMGVKEILASESALHKEIGRVLACS
jgi:hypothetical protein